MTINVFGGGNSSAPVFPVQRSVRLRSNASAYFNRTFASTANTWTFSVWIKRGTLGTVQNIAASRLSGTGSATLNFNADDTLSFVNSLGTSVTTTAVYRDPSAWYHIVARVTQSSTSFLYVNGVQVATWAAGSASYLFNSAWTSAIGRPGDLNSQYFDGYLTEVNFIDGQALTPTSFGSINSSTGVWQPIKYSGTYGTNGFYLNFQDNSGATATTIGKDSSGNGNNWTPNNISVTAGVTYDSMLDVPTLTGATNANFCTLNPTYAASTSVTDGNLTHSRTAASWNNVAGSIYVTSGKWYFEVTKVGSGGGIDYTMVGVANNSAVSSEGYTTPSNSWTYLSSGNKYGNGTNTTYGATFTGGDVIGVALDMDAGTITFYKNNTSQGTAFTGLTGQLAPWVGNFANSGTSSAQCNFGQRPFSYTPPTGFKSLNTYNLPDSTIPNGATQFAATTYTGTGSSLAIFNTVNGKSFTPDFVWVKGRSGATDHALYDSVRGTTKQLESNATAAETTEATGLTAFDSSGFTVGALAQMNTNAATYVGWQWKAGGAAVTNTSGSISSQVSANPSAGFSIVTYTGTGSGAVSVGHGLGVAPRMIIVKDRSLVRSWSVYHISMGNTNGVALNATTASAAATGWWNNTSPTSSVFTVGTFENEASSYVAYCFSEIAGFSKFGSYTGNGSADGVFVYLGFRPRWIMIGPSSNVTNWTIIDTSRNTYNLSGASLYANLSNVETSVGSGAPVDILSNGFKWRTTAQPNTSGQTYIYAAFAENPFKNALAR
jgi:hypothetical protein